MKMKYMKRYWQVLIVVGIVTFIFGVVLHKNMTGISPNMSMLNGMMQGAGFAIAIVGGFKLLQNKRTPLEKLKAKEIELNDERNIQLMRISLSISSTVATLIFGIMAFAFVAMNYIVPALISIAALYIQLISLFVSYKYFDKKM